MPLTGTALAARWQVIGSRDGCRFGGHLLPPNDQGEAGDSVQHGVLAREDLPTGWSLRARKVAKATVDIVRLKVT